MLSRMRGRGALLLRTTLGVRRELPQLALRRLGTPFFA